MGKKMTNIFCAQDSPLYKNSFSGKKEIKQNLTSVSPLQLTVISKCRGKSDCRDEKKVF